jgi:hypothetical protein
MARCSPGDRVVCHIKNNLIVNTYDNEWDDKHIFDIVSKYEGGYMIYVPLDMSLRDSVFIDSSNYKKFNAEKRFIDSYLYYITDYHVISIFDILDGLRCKECDSFYSMSTSNQPDGTLICWSCRKYKTYL